LKIKYIYIIIIAIANFLPIIHANAQSEWHGCNCDMPIYYRVCESGKDYQVKCKFTINAPIEKCIDIFCNAANHTKWIYNCIESSILENDLETGVFRNVIDAPFFMKDRDVFVKYDIKQNSNGSIIVTNICLPDYRPRNDKYERITRLKATYKFTPKSRNSTEVDYFTETGGPSNLSDFLLHIFLCKSTEQTILNLNNMSDAK